MLILMRSKTTASYNGAFILDDDIPTGRAPEE